MEASLAGKVTTQVWSDAKQKTADVDELGNRTSYTYEGSGLKFLEVLAGATTTLVWDGTEYLQART